MALSHWLKYTATKAWVGFLRPRVNDDPEAFMIESLLRQGFVADLVTNSCNVDTAESNTRRCSIHGTSASWVRKKPPGGRPRRGRF